MSDKAEKAKKSGFFSRVQAEYKKIIWPTKESAAKNTFAVVVVSLILGVIIALLDTVFTYGINFLMGL